MRMVAPSRTLSQSVKPSTGRAPSLRFRVKQPACARYGWRHDGDARTRLLPAIGFLSLLVIFVMATLLGFLSHAPGSLGVLEAAMLIGLSQFDKEQVLASLLIYRALYFILPLFVAIMLLGVRELRLAVGAWRVTR
jgi:hypothetical protein